MYMAVDVVWFLAGLTFLSSLVLWVGVGIYSRIHKSISHVMMKRHAGEPVKSYWKRGAGWIALDIILLLLFFLFVADALLSLLSFVLALLIQNGIDIFPRNTPVMALMIFLSCSGALLVIAYIYVCMQRHKRR